MFGEHRLELLGLARGARKTVEDAAFGMAVLVDESGHHIDDDVVRSQPTLLYVRLHFASQLRAARDLVADDLARRDVRNAVVLFQPLRLRAFAAARSAE